QPASRPVVAAPAASAMLPVRTFLRPEFGSASASAALSMGLLVSSVTFVHSVLEMEPGAAGHHWLGLAVAGSPPLASGSTASGIDFAAAARLSRLSRRWIWTGHLVSLW